MHGMKQSGDLADIDFFEQMHPPKCRPITQDTPGSVGGDQLCSPNEPDVVKLQHIAHPGEVK